MKKILKATTSPWDINPDALLFTDLHLHERSELSRADSETGLNSRFLEGLSILYQIHSVLVTHPIIKKVFYLGDFFELKDRIPNHILIEFEKHLIAILNTGVKFIALRGNHDFNLEKYSILEIFKFLKGSKFVSEPIVHIGDDLKNIGLLPFQRNYDKFVESWNFLHEHYNLDYLFFHQEVPGAKYESGKIVPFSKVGTLLQTNSTTIYISGHLHNAQKVGVVQYLGSPYHIKFSDEGISKFIYLLNISEKRTSSLKLTYPEFIHLNIADTKTDDLFNRNIKDKYIKLIGEINPAIDIWDSKIKSSIRKKLENGGAKGVTFDVDIIRPEKQEIPQEKIEDDKYVIETYLRKVHLSSGLNLDRLIKMGIDIFEESE